MAFSRAWRYPNSKKLHFDDDCAAEWLEAQAGFDCSAVEPWTPGCYITYGDLAEGEHCDLRDECKKGLRCLDGLCRSWGLIGDYCRFDQDCEDSDAYCGSTGVCERVPVVGKSCVSQCEFGSFCYEGLCVPHDMPCGGCSRGEVCVDTLCIVPRQNGEPCSYSSECLGRCDEYGNTCIDYDPAICWSILE